MLARREVAPHDEITGLSCVLAPPPEPLTPNSPDTSDHHTNHSEAIFLEMGLLGRTIRASRLQLARNVDHNYGPYGYHRYYNRSYLPDNRIGQCGLVLFGVVGAVPGRVIDVHGDGERQITDEERQRLFTGNEIRVQSRSVISRYFTAFVLDAVEHHAPPRMKRKYKDSRHEDDKQGVAHEMIDKLLPWSFKMLEEPYEEAKQNGSLPESAPPEPAEVARPFIFEERQRFNMLDDVIFNNGANLWRDPFLKEPKVA